MDKAQINPELLLDCIRRMTHEQRSELYSLLFSHNPARQHCNDSGVALLQANFRAAMLENEIVRLKLAAMPSLPQPVPFVIKNETAPIAPNSYSGIWLGVDQSKPCMRNVDLDATRQIKSDPVWPSDAVRHVRSHADLAAFGSPADRTTIGPTTEAALVVHNGERRLLAVDLTRQYVTVTNDAHLEVRFDYGRPGAIQIAGQATINKIVRDWGDHKELRSTRLLSFCPDDRVRDYMPIAAAMVDTKGRLTVQFHPPGPVERTIMLGAAPIVAAANQELHHLKGWPTVEVNHTTLTHLKHWREDTAHNLPD